MSTLLEKAMRIATRAHAGQTRKESDLPYITHPFMVALKLAKHGFSDKVLAAALLHDVLEDTTYTKEDLRKEVGEEVLKLIETVTYEEGFSWEEKRDRYIKRVRNSSEEVRAISIADKIHNAESLILGYQSQGKDIWKNFNRSKEQKIFFEQKILKMFKETWQHSLVDEFEKLVRETEKLEE